MAISQRNRNRLWEYLCESGNFDSGPFTIEDIFASFNATSMDRSTPGLREAIVEFLDEVAEQHKADEATQNFEKLPDGSYTFGFQRN